MARTRIGISNFRLATLWSCLNRGWKRQVNSRDLQIALHQETKSLPPIAAAWAARRRFVLSWIIAACLTLARDLVNHVLRHVSTGKLPVQPPVDKLERIE